MEQNTSTTVQQTMEASVPSFAAAAPMAILAKALIAAQKDLKNPPKTKTARIVSKAGVSFSYSYSDLADVIDTVRPVLAKHGLAIMHVMDRFGDGWALTARIIHESGEHLDSMYPVPKGIAGAQELGSWLTYMRRYSTCNLLFISGETDEDGAKATEAERSETVQDAPKSSRKSAAVEQTDPGGQRVSAYDGRKLAPGEDPLPTAKQETPAKPTVETIPLAADHHPDLEPEKGWEDVPQDLAKRMREDRITPQKLMEILGPQPKGCGILSDGMTIKDIPADTMGMLVKDVNWKKVVNKAKGVK